MDDNTLPAGMTMLARVHRELGRIEGDRAAASAPRANYVDASSARVYARRAAAMIRSWATSSSDAAIAEATMRLAHDLWEVEKSSVDSLPRQLVHGDFWDNNVLFRDGGVVGILDLDFMEERPRIDDLGLILYYAYPSLRSAVGVEGALTVLARLVRAYVSEADPALSRAELMALPYAIARSALHFTRHLELRISEAEQREVVDAAAPDLEWALEIARDASRWQRAFAE